MNGVDVSVLIVIGVECCSTFLLEIRERFGRDVFKRWWKYVCMSRCGRVRFSHQCECVLIHRPGKTCSTYVRARTHTHSKTNGRINMHPRRHHIRLKPFHSTENVVKSAATVCRLHKQLHKYNAITCYVAFAQVALVGCVTSPKLK